MIYQAIESLAADLAAGWAADMAAAVAAAGNPPGIDQSLVVYAWQDAEIFAAIPSVPGAAARLPGCGIYFVDGTTEAKTEQRRYAALRIARDYFARGADALVLARQTALAVEALMKHVDRCYGLAGIVGTAEDRRSVTIQASALVRPQGMDYYEQHVTLLVPSTTLDTGL